MTGSVASLRAVQVALHDHLLDRASPIAGQVREGGRITVEQRLGIYHHAYRARLQETLQDNFERTWGYLGDEAFAAAALAFIASHAPSHRNLRWYGEQFVGWLAERFPADLDISELAMIDWGLRSAFDGPDAAPVTAAALAQLDGADWESLGCRFVPTLCVVPVAFNTVTIWHALNLGETPPVAARLDDPTWLMIWRKGWEPHFRTIGPDEHAMVSQLRAGTAVAAACAELNSAGFDERAALAIATHLRTWIDEELIAELTCVSGSTTAKANGDGSA